MIQKIIYVFLVTFLVNCFANDIVYKDCTETDPKNYCKINKIEISDCKEAGTTKPCNLKKGKTYSLKVHFTALEAMGTMKSSPFWAASSASDLPFVGMNEEACQFTQCPVAKNAEQIYDFRLKIAKSLPRGHFDVKWKFWADGNVSNGCCARFPLKLY